MFVPFLLYLFIPIVAVVVYSFAGRWAGTILPEQLTLRFWQQAFADPGNHPGIPHVAHPWICDHRRGAAPRGARRLLVPRAQPAHIAPARHIRRHSVRLAVRGHWLRDAPVHGLRSAMDPGNVCIARADVRRGELSVRLLVAGRIDGGIERPHAGEAAATCGASATQTIVRVVLPAIKPGLATAAMLALRQPSGSSRWSRCWLPRSRRSRSGAPARCRQLVAHSASWPS